MARVTVIGSYIVALVMDTERIPIEGETVMGRNYHTTHGGKGSNMAVCASRLGVESTFLGKIGKDQFGEDFITLLQSENVDSEHVPYSEHLPTAVGFIVFSDRGSNLIVIDIAANGEFLPSDVEENEEIIRHSDVVLSPLEIPLETALTGAKVAQSHGIPSILNPAPAADLRNVNLGNVFVLTPNETEGRVCLGMDPTADISDEELAERLLELGPEHIVLTLGAKGVLWVSQTNGLRRIPALPVNVVDSVGAGDAFNAGLAAGLARKKSMAEAIALGITAGSLSTEKRETIDSYPSIDAVNARIDEVLNNIS